MEPTKPGLPEPLPWMGLRGLSGRGAVQDRLLLPARERQQPIPGQMQTPTVAPLLLKGKPGDFPQ